MPKYILKSLTILGLMTYWFNGSISPSYVHAVTIEQTATVSATATVPATTPTTTDTTAPTNPILIRPTDGTITGDNKPEFVWRQSTDPNGNTVTYTLYLNGVATYLGISNLGNSSGLNYTARLDGVEVKLLPSTILPNGVYKWYVSAEDLSGNVSYSTTWTFTVDTSPPPLTLVDLDNIHNPVVTTGSNFDIAGPKDINFTVLTDPFIEVQISLNSNNYEQLNLQSPSNKDGLAYLYKHLTPGIYTVTIIAIDRAGNTSVLPDFTLTITQAEIKVYIPGIPGSSPTSIMTIPYAPIAFPSLPATIAKLETRLPLTYLVSMLLAILVWLLLIILWKRRYNLILLDQAGNPIVQGTIYHSIPDTRSKLTQVLVTKREPISYLLKKGDRGRLYIQGLTRYSTLTVRLEDATYLLSLSVKAKTYVIILG